MRVNLCSVYFLISLHFQNTRRKETERKYLPILTDDNGIVFLPGFPLREGIESVGEEKKVRNWLVGCMRNLDSILASIILLEQADVKPKDLVAGKNRNIKLFIEAWDNLVERDAVLTGFRTKMEELTKKTAWRTVFKKAFDFLIDS